MHNDRMHDAITLACPFCGERFQTLVDLAEGEAEYVEDCPVCCRPIRLRLHVDDSGEFSGLDAERDD